MQARHRRRAANYCSGALLILACAAAFVGSTRFAGVDYYQFWLVPQIRQEFPQANIYSPQDRKDLLRQLRPKSINGQSSKLQTAAEHRTAELRLSATPLAYTLLSLFAGDSYEHSLFFFRLISLLTMLAASLYCVARLDGGWVLGAVVTAALLLLFEPLKSDLRVGNSNQLILGATVTALALLAASYRRAQVTGGFILGVAVLVKPTIAFLPLFLVLSRLRRSEFLNILLLAIGGLLAGCFAFAVSAWYFASWECWFDWFSIASELSQQQLYPFWIGNFSLPALLAAFSVAPNQTLVFLGIALLVLVAYFGAGKGKESFASLITLMTMSMLCFFLVSAVFWVHYFILLVPGITLAATSTNQNELAPAARLLAALTVCLWFIPSFIQSTSLGPVSIHTLLACYLAGFLLLLVQHAHYLHRGDI